MQPGDRDDREDGVAQGVLEEHDALGDALGPRRADIVGAENFEHAGAGEAAVLRDVDDREREGGQHQMMGDIERAAEIAHR